jgi:peptidoglycan/LPS O-acetylase OafA/YrhL
LLQNRLHILDSFRGIAALVVFFHHIYTKFYNLFPNRNSWYSYLLNYISSLNEEAVLFFFFISGFSIALSLNGRLPSSNKEINFYLFKRVRRIVPLYMLALCLTAICGVVTQEFWIDHSFRLQNLIGNLLFLQNSNSYTGNWFVPYGKNGPLWSISFEMWYYIFLPSIFLFQFKITRNYIRSNYLIDLGLLISWCATIFSIWLNKQFYLPWIAYLTLFILWYLGFWIGIHYKQKTLSLKHLFYLLIITSFHFIISQAVDSATLVRLRTGTMISSIFLIFYFLKKYLSYIYNRIEYIFYFLFNEIGSFSYPLYLIHFPILLVCKKYFPDSSFALIVTVIFILCLSSVLEIWFKKQKFYFFERNYLPIKERQNKL